MSQEFQLDTDKFHMRQCFVFAAAIIFVFPHGLKAAPSSACLEPQSVEEKIFFPTKLSEAKADARDTEFLPIQNAIEEFIKTHSQWKFTKIEIISSSAQTPITKPGRISEAEIAHVRKLNHASNNDLARTRMGFAKFGLSKIKSQNLALSGVELSYSSEVLGPDYTYHSDPRKHDQNLKFMVREFSKDYEKKAREIFETSKSDYAKVGITKVEELYDEGQFKSLYDLKFKAFQGYTIFFRGKISCQLKILPTSKPSSTSKQ